MAISSYGVTLKWGESAESVAKVVDHCEPVLCDSLRADANASVARLHSPAGLDTGVAIS